MNQEDEPLSFPPVKTTADAIGALAEVLMSAMTSPAAGSTPGSIGLVAEGLRKLANAIEAHTEAQTDVIRELAEAQRQQAAAMEAIGQQLAEGL